MSAFDLATSGPNFNRICYGVLNRKLHMMGVKEYLSAKADDLPAELALHPALAVKMLFDLLEESENNYPLIGWGTLGFDCKVLFEETAGQEEVYKLAYNHVDLFFQILIHTEQYVSIAEFGAYYGKIIDPNMGKETSSLWTSGDRNKQEMVIGHHRKIAMVLYDAWGEIVRTNRVYWIDKKSGREAHVDLPLHSNGFYLERMRDLPIAALHSSMRKQTAWLREYERKLKSESSLQIQPEPDSPF